jgi:glutathione S-transferase
MIKLYGFKPLWGLCDISAFVAKVDMYLRMAGIPYTLQPHPFFELDKAPKGKLPFIEDGDKRIADSTFIIEYLKRTYGDPLDGHLSAQEKAIAHAMRRMMDENLYWVIIQIRWRIEENWKPFMDELFDDPANKEAMAPVLPKIRESVVQSMWAHGMGRHSIDEVWEIGKADVTAMADLLADKPYFFGDRPTSLDASAHAFLTGLRARFESPVKKHLEAHQNLVSYCKRIEDRYGSR